MEIHFVDRTSAQAAKASKRGPQPKASRGKRQAPRKGFPIPCHIPLHHIYNDLMNYNQRKFRLRNFRYTNDIPVKLSRVVSSRVVSSRVVSSRVVSSRVESSRVVSSRVESSRVVSSRVESSRVVSSRVESSRVVSSRVVSSRVVSSRVVSSRVE